MANEKWTQIEDVSPIENGGCVHRHWTLTLWDGVNHIVFVQVLSLQEVPKLCLYVSSRCGFKPFFFTPKWRRCPIWLIFFRWLVQPPTRSWHVFLGTVDKVSGWDHICALEPWTLVIVPFKTSGTTVSTCIFSRFHHNTFMRYGCFQK